MRELFFITKCFVLAFLVTLFLQLPVNGKSIERYLLSHIKKSDITQEATQFSKDSLDYIKSDEFLNQTKCKANLLKENISDVASHLVGTCSPEKENI